ncbi:MAG: helix-turn-helix domain-containing protein [Pseudomonadota bacterium]|nr:helix-turn-helix domain-containing protein [Pseudomonadota bacterium]
MSRADLARDPCTVARAAELLGDPWTLLILRELFLGARRFDDFQRQTGGSPHLLSQRLKRLEADGVVRRRRYSLRPPRDEYRLTEKGRDLWPVVAALKGWGDRWLADDVGIDAPDEEFGPKTMRLVHRSCGAPALPRMACAACGEPMTARDSVVEVSPAWAEARAARARAPRGTRPSGSGSSGTG